MSKPKIVMLKLKDLVHDQKVYPRATVDDAHVRRLREARRCGETLPPIEVEESTKRIVDGVHRYKAELAEQGEDGEIACILHRYASELEFFSAAVRANTAHGQPLAAFDHAHCLTIMRRFGASDEVIRTTLKLSEETFHAMVKRKLALHKGEPVAIKNTLRHLAGTEISEPVMAANRRAGGMRPEFYINQVISLLQNDALDWTNEHVVAGLKQLAEVLDAKLAEKV